MDQIKGAFAKVKQDISFLQEELFFIKRDIQELKEVLYELVNLSEQTLLNIKKEKSYKENTEEESRLVPTQEVKKPTDTMQIPTDRQIFKPLKTQNQRISIGNEGVPTDRQTNQQTNQQTDFPLFLTKNQTNQHQKTQNQITLSQLETTQSTPFQPEKDAFKEAIGVLESLDNIKKELRLKFKRLTEQEILVFSSIYQIEEEKGHVDYKALSSKLNLTESSIREYVGKLIKKGIPVEKIKINNKSVQLKISSDLKRIANLSTILLLRDI